MDKKRKSKKANKSLGKKSAKKRDSVPTNARHREDFEQLLDDSIFGVRKK